MKRLLLALAAVSMSTALSGHVPLLRVSSSHIERVSQYTTYASHSLSACGKTRPVGTQLAQIAVSRDLFRLFGGCGVKVRLTLKDGVSREYQIWDKMAIRWRNSADILVASRRDALNFGITSGWLSRR